MSFISLHTAWAASCCCIISRSSIHSGPVVWSCLGPPLKGSGVAHFISRNVVLKHLTLGASSSSLLGNVPAWRGTRPLAVLAGTRGLGIGQMLGAPLERPNDGAVAVSETRVKSCTVHKLIPYSHTGMLLAKPVAAMIDEFLRTGNIT